MAENLNYAIGGKCGVAANTALTDNNTDICDIYGRLYNWETAMDGSASSIDNPSGVQGVCPDGWHLPSTTELYYLRNLVDSEFKGGTKLKSESWPSYSAIPKGSDTYGFAALPGGYGGHDQENNEQLFNLNYSGHWWSSSESEDNNENAYYFLLYHDEEYLGISAHGNKSYFRSIRCIRN